jgi:DNA ligase-1
MISEDFRPLLAATVDLDKVKFPCYVSPKLDGIRVLGMNGKAMTRRLKEVPNRFIQSVFASGIYDGLDGEIIVGPANAPDVYRVTNSAVMSRDGEPDFTYHVFDLLGQQYFPFSSRLEGLATRVHPRVVHVPQVKVHDLAGLHDAEEGWLSEGYEGLMGRSIDGVYKYGRATMKEGILWKLKRMSTSEAVIEGVVELERNLNEAKLNELGYTERSTAKDGMAGGGTMGALLVRDIETSVLFSIGTGFTLDERDTIWVNRGSIVGKIITYNHFSIGNYDKPRFPSFKGFRDKRDL